MVRLTIRKIGNSLGVILPQEALAALKLGEGDSLRLDINGTIVAVAKVDGNIYAFQEFCTHRFGPLSEGSFEGTNVRCPWHGSCFDMRSGKVVEGPAKTDIRAFEVEVRDGQVRIRVTEDV